MSKELVAKALAQRVQDGEVLGLGSGSTAEIAVQLIGERIKREGIKVAGVPTSHRIAIVAQAAGVDVLSTYTDVPLAWAFDGADEVDPDFNMIKGRGAAMLTEKIIARRAGERLVIIVGEDKLVDKLGKCALPLEVIPEALSVVQAGLRSLGAVEVLIRESNTKYGATFSEHNNLILDVRFQEIRPEMEVLIKSITGVVESGLFVDATKELLVAKADGVWSHKMIAGKVKEELLAL